MNDGALSGITVVELAEGVAGPYCGRLLAAHGARVIKVETPGGDPARTLLPRDDRDPQSGGGLFGWLNARKESVVLDPGVAADRESLLGLCAGAQVVIDHRGETERAGSGLDLNALREANPGLILCDVTWFGQGGPYAGYAGSDGICAALSGLAFGIGEVGGAPTLPSGYEPQVVAGVTAAIAVLIALLDRSGTAGARIDLSVLESFVVLSETAAVARSYDQNSIPRRFGINRYPPTYPLGVFHGADGWVGITALTPSQWRALCELLGLGALGPDPEFFTSWQRFVRAEELDPQLARAISTWKVRELVTRAQARRIPLTIVPTPEEIIALPEFVARGTLSRIALKDGRSFAAPGIPFRLGRTPGDGSGPVPSLDGGRGGGSQREKDIAPIDTGSTRAGRTALPLEGIRIIDLSMGWSGPLAARYCADFGAEVIKVEACQYVDWWRGWEATREWVEEKRYEKVAAFNTMNRNKNGITLDLTRPAGADLLRRLVAQADAVIENNTSTVLPKLGLDYAALREVNPQLVMISMPAFGMDSPWSDHRAYGSTVEQASGLPHLNGRADWPPTQQHVALGDAIAGINAAVAMLLALYHKRRTGEGQFVDFSQVESLLPLAAHGIIEQSLNGKRWPRLGSRHPELAPHDVFRCAGEESWLAITCQDDRQWQDLARAIGRDDLAIDVRFATRAARKTNEDELYAIIESWSLGRDAEDAMRVLQARGVAAGVVRSAQNLLDDLQLQAREYFVWAEGVHDTIRVYPLAAFTLDGLRPGVRVPAPTLGQHNEKVLRERLGLSDDEIEALRRDSIIGTIPIL